MAFKRGNQHKNNVAMSNLRFSVVACTSEDASFSVSNLTNHVATNQGYMTTKNCSYPQELILQLQRGLCRVTQVQIMSHETHIATKMELFVSKSLHFDRETTCFSRVGFLTLQDNTESNYKARELKTVHLDQEMTLLKLRIHGCHDNEHNLYRQVGIMAINLCGKVQRLLPNHMLDEAVATSSKQKKKKCDDEGCSCDVTMAARIREVQVAKNKAVVSEDYDQAKRLKEMEEQLQAISRKLARLKAQKSEAVANEDYDLAKKVKLEIGRVEGSVRNNESLPILSKFASSSMRSQVVHTSEAVLSSSLNASSTDMYPEKVPQVANSESFYEGSDLSLRHSPQGSYKQDPRYGGNDTDQEDGNDGGPNPQFRGIPGAADLPDPEEIAAGLAKESEELIFVIGPFFTRCFYSNLWNHRDATIRKVTMEMNNYPVEPKQLLEVCSKLAQSGAGDRIVQVALSAFGLLDRMVSFGARLRHEDMCRILGNSMPQLVNRLGGSQAKIRDETAAVLGHMAAAKNVGVAFVTSYLIKHSSKPLGIKILQGRLLLLKKLLAEFELVSESDFSAPSIMQFLEDSNSLAHQCREIRDAAKDITVSLYLAVGTEVEGFLKHLRPKQLEEYQAAFETVKRAKVLNHCSGATAAAVSNGSGSRRDEIHCKIEEQFELDVEDMNDSEDKESVDEYTCPFCGVVDEKFDSDYLDQHFWGNCKMLTPCKMCGQVIEISTLNEHLLAECEMQQNHRECPRCGEAIITKFYERHVSLDDCTHRAPLESANRCPLCHDDIAPGEKGWRRHLLDEGCPNNPRR